MAFASLSSAKMICFSRISSASTAWSSTGGRARGAGGKREEEEEEEEELGSEEQSQVMRVGRREETLGGLAAAQEDCRRGFVTVREDGTRLPLIPRAQTRRGKPAPATQTRLHGRTI